MKKISIKLFSSSLIPLVLMFSLTFNINQELKNRVNINNEVITELVSSNDYLSLNNPVLETNLEALGKAPTKTEFTYDTETEPDEVGRFTSQLDMDIETFHSKLGNRAGIKKQAKPKTTDGKTYKGLDANGNPIFE
jgi:hypothetical protein